MVKIRLVLSAALALSLLMLSGFVAVTADAHTPKVAVSCDALTVTLTSYDASQPNHLKVTVNGAVVHDLDFASGETKTFTAPDKYTAFSYVVEVTAWDDPHATKGYAFTESGSSTPCTPPTPPCVNKINSSNVTAGYTTDPFHAHVQYTGGTLCAGVTKTVSLNSYATDGATWPTSGTQVFAGHDSVTIDQNTTSGDLEVPAPSCYYQTDLYWGSTRFDGTDGALPHYNDSRTPTDLIDWRNGGSACQQPAVKPAGLFTQKCTDTGAEVTIGALSSGSYQDVVWTLTHDGTSKVVVQGEKVLVGSQVPLELTYTAKHNLSGSVQTGTSEKACPPPVVVAPKGLFTTECTASGAQADVGTLAEGSVTGGRFELRWGSTVVVVSSGQQNVTVGADDTVKLYYVPPSGTESLLDTQTSPKACTPPVVAPAAGSFTTECTATGAQADVGTLTEGTATGGRFELRSGTTVVVVTSGQQNVAVPASAAVKLYYVPASGAESVLDTEQAPAACTPIVAPPPPVVPQRDLSVAKVVTPTGAVQFGATLTYTLTVQATGNAPQTNVVVTDQVPTGTTYVGASASCDAGICSPVFADGTVTWGLGGMAAGSSRSVSFQVTLDTPEADEDGALPAVEVRNVGAVSSTEVPTRPSNEVVTPVVAILGVKVGPPEEPTVSNPTIEASVTPTGVLAATGSGTSVPVSVGVAALLLLLGITLLAVGGPGPRPTTE